ncbi:MAG: DUF3137 domain-containing protein [Eubacteriales bacterium]
MTNEQLESRLKSLRVKAVITKILTFCAAAAMIIVWFFMEKLAIGLVLLAVALVSAYVSSVSSSALKKLLSDNVISGVLKEALGDGVEYNPWGKTEPGNMAFPFSYNKVDGSDHIKAVYKGLNIELSDIELIEETEDTDENGNTQKSSTTHFKGQWLICDFGKELSGEVCISANDKKLRKQHKNDSVEMENDIFNKRFLVTSGNAHEAYYILTPHMMEYILSMADKSGGDVYMSFRRDGKMQIAVRTGRDFFELGKSNANVEELHRKFLGELRWFTDMIDTLRVEDTLYLKEANR